jgi:hypothetical protein
MLAWIFNSESALMPDTAIWLLLLFGYEPLEGTIAHSVSRRKMVNAAAVAVSVS